MRRTRISLLAATAWPLLLLAQESANNFQALAQRAVELQQSGDERGAEAVYRKLLTLDPNQVATRVNLAIVLVTLGKYDEGIEQYRAAAKLLPGDSRIALNLALAFEKSGRLEEACKEFQSLHESAPAEDKFTLLLADCDGQLGKDAQVVELLQPIATAHQEDLAFSYMLGMALLHQHRVEDGQVFLDRILRNGDTAEARYLLATRMFESGDYPAAVQQFQKTLELNSNLPHVNGFYGQALLNTGDPDGAVKAFRRELSLDGNDYAANLGLAQILVVRKQFADALAPAKRAQEISKDSADANVALAQALAGTGQWSGALEVAEHAATLLPGSAEVHRTLASAYAALRKPDLAARERQTAADLEAKAAESQPGPKLNEPAPEFRLSRAEGGGEVSLSDYRGHSPLVLIFGSYSCPNFRNAAESLKTMQVRYGARIPFLLVYIREAHSTTGWQSTRNRATDESLDAAATMSEKQEHAGMCSRKLHLSFPALVDGMDNRVESVYSAWPSRAFIISADGRVAYRTGLTELEFHPEEMEATLRKLTHTKELSARQ